jgi:hypothetical protein
VLNKKTMEVIKMVRYEIWLDGEMVEEEDSRIRAIEKTRELKGTLVMIKNDDIYDAWDMTDDDDSDIDPDEINAL